MSQRGIDEGASGDGVDGRHVPELSGEIIQAGPIDRGALAGELRRPRLTPRRADAAPGADGSRRKGDPASIRVLVADDHPILCEGLASLINRQPGMEVIGEANDGRTAVEMFGRLKPDIGVIELRMPGLDGVEAITAIREIDPQARLVMLTNFANVEDIYRALRAGVRGYLLKDGPRQELIDCLRAVHEGRTFIPSAVALKLAERVGTAELTGREREVLALIAKGKGNREIGSTLKVTEGTVKVHVNNILTKLGVSSRTEAVNIAARRGLVRLDD